MGSYSSAIGLTLNDCRRSSIFWSALRRRDRQSARRRSSGDFRTAILKLAAIAVFNDGVITWVDAAVNRFAGFGAGGLFGFGILGLPIAAGVYWSLLIYLFSMDPGDSWLVVIILAVVYRIFRFAMMLLLLGLVLSWGGVGSSAMPSFGGAHHAAVVSPMVNEVEDAKGRGLMNEARKFIADGHQIVLKDVVNEWYADGSAQCLVRDGSGHQRPREARASGCRTSAG